MTTARNSEVRELSADEMERISGGNFWLGVAAGVLGNFIYDRLKNDEGLQAKILKIQGHG